MTPADAVRDALAPLALAGYDATPSGLVQALADQGEARSLLTAWLDGDETCATLQRARAWVDARRAAAAVPVCVWSSDPDIGPWRTGCGRLFETLEGTPTDNGFRFCVFCGGALLERHDLQPPNPVERRNCWTCRHAYEETTGCNADWSVVRRWVTETHLPTLLSPIPNELRCPPDADGCPGWQPTDPPPSADYVGPGWADGVPRG